MYLDCFDPLWFPPLFFLFFFKRLVYYFWYSSYTYWENIIILNALRGCAFSHCIKWLMDSIAYLLYFYSIMWIRGNMREQWWLYMVTYVRLHHKSTLHICCSQCFSMHTYLLLPRSHMLHDTSHYKLSRDSKHVEFIRQKVSCIHGNIPSIFTTFSL